MGVVKSKFVLFNEDLELPSFKNASIDPYYNIFTNIKV